jgi:hypothetical protein
VVFLIANGFDVGTACGRSTIQVLLAEVASVLPSLVWSIAAADAPTAMSCSPLSGHPRAHCNLQEGGVRRLLLFS